MKETTVSLAQAVTASEEGGRQGHLSGRRVAVERSRARRAAELQLPTYAHFADRDPLTPFLRRGWNEEDLTRSHRPTNPASAGPALRRP